jgi:thiol-disulfide isomerase/thioredoxin
VLKSKVRYLRITFAITCAMSVISVPAAEPPELGALRGRVVYLDFWASWCVPCRESFPWMRTLEANYSLQGLTVIAVNLDHDRADADTFLRRFHPDFQIRFDPEGHWAQQFGVRGMPTSVIIDRYGAVRFTHIGFRPADAPKYTHQIEQLLAEH